VDEHLPKRQRTGSIPRKEMNRIATSSSTAPANSESRKARSSSTRSMKQCIIRDIEGYRVRTTPIGARIIIIDLKYLHTLVDANGESLSFNI